MAENMALTPCVGCVMKRRNMMASGSSTKKPPLSPKKMDRSACICSISPLVMPCVACAAAGAASRAAAAIAAAKSELRGMAAGARGPRRQQREVQAQTPGADDVGGGARAHAVARTGRWRAMTRS